MVVCSSSSLKQQLTYRSTRSHYSDSESTSLYFSLHNTTCSATNANFKVFGLTQPETESTFYYIQNEYASIKPPRRLLKQELPTLPEHMSSPPVFSGVRVTRSLVLYVCFVDRCLSFCTFSFGHCVLLRFTDSDYLPLVSLTLLYIVLFEIIFPSTDTLNILLT